MASEFRSDNLRIPKIAELVADRIRARIVRGELREGDSLPLEAVLMESLRVSRSTVREASRILEAEGLINVVRGSRSGAIVNRPTSEMASRYAGYVLEWRETSIADLYSGQMAIELTVVRCLATARGQTPKMPTLRAALNDLAETLRLERREHLATCISLFHEALVDAGGNQTLSFMSGMLQHLACQHQNDYLRRYPSESEDTTDILKKGVKSYKELVDRIDEGLVDSAVNLWESHLKNKNKVWISREEGGRILNSIQYDAI